MLFIFFFKQKTAYEMRISDWSSDVCSSDLLDQELIMLEECIFAVIRYVLIVIAELIQARKRRTVDTKADTVAWYGADDLTRIALIDCIVDRKSTRLNSSH